MRSWLGFSFTLFLTCCTRLSALDERFYDKGSNVVALKSVKDFKARVSNSSFLWVLQLYREGCGFCKLLEAEYESVATDLKHMVNFAAIDTERSGALASAVTKKYGFKVEGVPTVVMVKPGASVAQEYRGERKAKALKQAAYGAMPSFVEVIPLSSLDSWLGEASEPLRRAVLFSAKAVVTPLLNAVSSAYRGRMKIAQVAADLKGRSSMLERFGVKRLPTLVVLKRDVDELEGAKWISEKFGEQDYATLTWADGEKPSFRKVEGWLMGYGRPPRTKPAKDARKASPGKGADL